MIRVERGEEIKRRGVFEYSVPSLGIVGKSRQPLLDACREIKRILGDTAERAGLFREGRSEPDISCSVKDGAGLTVSYPDGGSIHFAKWKPFDESVFREAAE